MEKVRKIVTLVIFVCYLRINYFIILYKIILNYRFSSFIIRIVEIYYYLN